MIHAVLFGIEAVLVGRLIAQRLTLRSSYVVVLWCTVLGGVLELIQHYHVKGRMGEPFDLLADMAGALMGLALLRLLQRK